jgi:hypothetical protein
VVAPRGTPRGETDAMVGGVVRLPVGESVVAAAVRAAAAAMNGRSRCSGAKAPRRLKPALQGLVLQVVVNLIGSIEAAYGNGFAIGGEA